MFCVPPLADGWHDNCLPFTLENSPCTMAISECNRIFKHRPASELISSKNVH